MKRHTLPPKRTRYPLVHAAYCECIAWAVALVLVCIACAEWGVYCHFTGMGPRDAETKQTVRVQAKTLPQSELSGAGSNPAISTTLGEQRLDRKGSNPAPVIGEATVGSSSLPSSTTFPTAGSTLYTSTDGFSIYPNGLSSGVEGHAEMVGHGPVCETGGFPVVATHSPQKLDSRNQARPAQSFHIKQSEVKPNAQRNSGVASTSRNHRPWRTTPGAGSTGQASNSFDQRQFNPRAQGIQLRMQGKGSNITQEDWYRRDVRNNAALETEKL